MKCLRRVEKEGEGRGGCGGERRDGVEGRKVGWERDAVHQGMYTFDHVSPSPWRGAPTREGILAYAGGEIEGREMLTTLPNNYRTQNQPAGPVQA